MVFARIRCISNDYELSTCNEIHFNRESYTIAALTILTKMKTNRASCDISAVISSPAAGNRP